MGKKLIPNNGCDKVYTPDFLAQKLVNYFIPVNKEITVLEPCRGNSAFVNALRYLKNVRVEWCEIDDGKDFFDYKNKVDWIISNFPWSQMRNFLRHSYEISDNVVSLSLVNALFMKARMRDMKEFGFGIKEIMLLDNPGKPFPQTGLSLGAIHLQKGYFGDVKFNYN